MLVVVLWVPNELLGPISLVFFVSLDVTLDSAETPFAETPFSWFLSFGRSENVARKRSQKFLVIKVWVFGSEKCSGFWVVNFLARKAPRPNKYRGVVGEGSNGHRTSPTPPSNLENANVTGILFSNLILITFTSRVHFILFSNSICNHLQADGTLRFSWLRRLDLSLNGLSCGLHRELIFQRITWLSNYNYWIT